MKHYLLAAALVAAAPASAAPTFYTDRAAFNAALVALAATPATETFEGAPASTYLGTNLPDQDPTSPRTSFDFGPFSLFGGRFQGVSGPVPDNSVFTGPAFFGAAGRQFGFVFDEAQNAFGVTIGEVPLDLSFDAFGQSFALTAGAAQRFIGVINPEATATLFAFTLNRNTAQFAPSTLDDVVFAIVPASVPEPAMLGLLGLGIGALALRSRRRA